MVRLTLLDLSPDELHYNPCIISLCRRDGSFNTVEDPLGNICEANKVKNLRLK